MTEPNPLTRKVFLAEAAAVNEHINASRQPAPSAPAAGDLRDRIAQAIADATGNNWPAQAFTTEADAVLAVLPEPVGQAIEGHRLALSEALGLGTGAPWDAIHGRAGDVDRLQGKVLELDAELAKLRDLLRVENKRANDAIGREETAEQGALEAQQDRVAVLREAANGLAALGPVDSLVSAPAAWTEAIETLRRMADQIAEDDLRRKAAAALSADCNCDPAPLDLGDGTYSHWAGCPIADAQQAADEAQQAGEGEPETLDPEVVAFRDPNHPELLLCRQHGIRYVGMVPLTSNDLPDGGICTFGRLSSYECGVDVLIPQAGETR